MSELTQYQLVGPAFSLSPASHTTFQRQPQLGDPCQNCRERPSTGYWTGDGGSLAYVHGCYALWCERCMVEKQIEHAEQCAARLPELRARLETLSA